MTEAFDSAARRDRAMALLARSRPICGADDIEAAVEAMAAEISRRFSDSYPVLCCVMTGALVLTGHLLPRLNFPLDIDYVDVSRYGDGDVGNSLTWHAKPRLNLTGRTVVLIDDILDEGHTLVQIKSALLEAGASVVYVAVLTEKILDFQKPIQADFVGLRLPNRFVFGYGMDAYGYWRNLTAIYAVDGEEGL